MICPHCGTQNAPGDRFCEQCGGPLPPAAATDPAITMDGSTEDYTLVPQSGGDPVELGARAVVGRMTSCDVPVQDKSVSREHARLTQMPGGYVLEDLNSTNGTLVNGSRISEATIVRTGDRITFGTVEYLLQGGAPAAATQSQPASALDFPPLQPSIAPQSIPQATWNEGAEAAPPVQADNPVSVEEVDVLPGAAANAVVPMQAEEAPGITAPDTSAAAEPVGAALADEVVAAAARLNDLVQRLADEMSGATSVRPVSAAPDLSDVLSGVPASPLTPEELLQAQTVLDGLAADPRDLELLMQIGRLAPALSRLVQQYGQIENTLNAVIARTAT